MDRLYPGFNRAHRDGNDADSLAFRRRQVRECNQLHGDGRSEIEWDEIQTYSVDETGRAALSDLALAPLTKGIDAFLHCIGKDNIGRRSFQAPPGTPPSFTITDSHIRFFREMSREELVAMIPRLERQLAEQQDLSPERREAMELTLAFWQCLLLRGVDSAGRAACRQEIEGE